MSDRIYFFRERNDSQVLKSLAWKSVCDASAKERDLLLRKLSESKYVPITMFVPVYLLRHVNCEE